MSADNQPKRPLITAEASAVTKRKDKPVPSTIVKPVDHAINILRYLNLVQMPCNLTMIAKELKINPSTCFNILRTLVWNGVIDFDPVAKTYRTGLGAVDLAKAALRTNGGSVAEQMRPQMEKLAHDYGVNVTIWRRIGEERMMLVHLTESPTSTVRVNMHLGQRLPLLLGAAGRVMAAFGGISKEEIAERFPYLRWNRSPKLEDYLRQVERAQKNGWAVDDGNFVAGVFSIAAPIFNPEGMLRGVVDATMLRGQHDKSHLRRITKEVRHLAESFTAVGQHASP